MDPEATLNLILDTETEPDAKAGLISDMQDWIKAGGYAPAGWSQEWAKTMMALITR